MNEQRRLAPLGHVSPNVSAWLAMLRRAPRGRVGSAPGWVIAAWVVAAVAAIAIITVVTDVSAVTQAARLPQWFVDIFGEITDFGKSGWVLVPTGCILLAVGLAASLRIGRMANLILAALSVRLSFVFLAVGIPGLFVTIVKRLIGRARPFVGGAENPYLYHPFSWRPDFASMPSGHATSAFATALAIGTVWPRSRPFVWTYALVIAASRVIVTAHHPSDVVAGALVGTVGMILVRNWFAARRLGFTVGNDGRVRAMPGPSWRRIKTIAGRLFHQ